MHNDRSYRDAWEGLVSEGHKELLQKMIIDVPPTNPSMIGPKANHMYVPGRSSQKWEVIKNTKSDSMRPLTLNANTVMRP